MTEASTQAVGSTAPDPPASRLFHSFSSISDKSVSIQAIVSVDDGKYIWASFNEGTIYVWDTQTGVLLATRKAQKKSAIFDMICVDHRGSFNWPYSWTVWTVGGDGTITIWNKSICVVKRLSIGTTAISALQQIGDHVWCSDTHYIYIIDIETLQVQTSFPIPHMNRILPELFQSNSPSQSASTTPSTPVTTTPSQDQSTIVNNTSSPSSSDHKTIPQPSRSFYHRTQSIAPPKPVNLPTPSYTRSTPTSTSTPSIAQVLLASTSSLSSPFTEVIYFVRFILRVDSYIWICTDAFIYFVCIKTMTVVTNLCIPIARINCLVYLTQTGHVWGASSDGSIYIWDAKVPSISASSTTPDLGTIEPIKIISGTSNQRVIRLVCLDGKYVWSAGWDKLVRVWDAQSFQLLKTMVKTHTYPVISLILLPCKLNKLRHVEGDSPRKKSPRSDLSNSFTSIPSSSLLGSNVVAPSSSLNNGSPPSLATSPVTFGSNSRVSNSPQQTPDSLGTPPHSREDGDYSANNSQQVQASPSKGSAIASSPANRDNIRNGLVASNDNKGTNLNLIADGSIQTDSDDWIYVLYSADWCGIAMWV